MTLRSLALAAGLVGAVLGTAVPAQDPLRADAASMQRKLLVIVARGEMKPAQKPAPLRTLLTDREVNAYFKVHGAEFMPDGVIDPQVAIDNGGLVRARAMVDLDKALKTKERSVLDPLAWLSGKVEVTAVGTLQAVDGKGRLAIETATLNGITIPKTLLQELVSVYSRSPDSAKGFSLDEPFALPANIRSVETVRGAATVVQ
jgi:hypothetical protein